MGVFVGLGYSSPIGSAHSALSHHYSPAFKSALNAAASLLLVAETVQAYMASLSHEVIFCDDRGDVVCALEGRWYRWTPPASSRHIDDWYQIQSYDEESPAQERYPAPNLGSMLTAT